MKETKTLDEIDSKILKRLLIESRTSFKDLSEICQVSPAAIMKRYARLKKDGIIIGEHMHLNPLSLGYEIKAEIGLLLTDRANKDKVIEQIKNKPHARIVAAIGKYDVRCQVLTKKLSELSGMAQQIEIKPYVNSLEVLLYADPNNSPWYPENLIVRPEERDQVSNCRPKEKKFEAVKLDEKDLAIAKALVQDSRTPFNDIAQSIDISTATAIKKYHHLREKNVLNISSVCINPLKLGYRGIADSYIKVKNIEDFMDVEEQLLQIPNLTYCAKFVGGLYDLRVAAVISDLDDFFGVRAKINSIDKIKRAEFYIMEKQTFWIHDAWSFWVLEYDTSVANRL